MSIYKRFRSVPKPDRNSGGARTGSGAFALSSRFDQPTYLSFRLIFAEDDEFYNNAANLDYVLNYDRMPHPLFASKGDPNIFDRKKYSSISYLEDANEFTRARMLQEWIGLWNKMQFNYQWYFQRIDGVNDLLKIDPLKGMRVASDKRLTITALEGVDLRMTHLLNMYRKIVWDDTYQRWVLPDMMRYFTLNIYISEFRTFHGPNPFNGYGTGTVGQNLKTAPTQLRLDILDDIIPTWKIKCEMCEFDLQTVEFDHLGSLGVDDMPNEAGVKFGIKIGKMYEEQIYPTFRNAFLVDKALNGLDRSKQYDIFFDEFIGEDIEDINTFFDSTTDKFNNNTTIYNNQSNLRIAQNESYTEDDHISGSPFNEQTNKTDIQGVNSHEGLPLSEATKGDEEEPNSRNTWLRNAGQLGLSYLENRFEQVLDKAKITNIPGLGISFTEVQSALQGKNIITALGLLRKGVNDVIQQYGQPSELLEGDIYIDAAFKAYLEGVAKSEATNELEVTLVEAANTALNNDGTWDKIKDFSLATNLVGPGEENSPVSIEGDYTPNVIQSAATNRNVEGGDLTYNPTSSLNENIPDSYEQPSESAATTSSLSSEALNQNIASSIDNPINEGGLSDINPESTLNDSIGDGYNQPTEGAATSRNISEGRLNQAVSDSAATESKNVDGGKLKGEESNINKKIPSGSIFEGAPSSQATTNKLQNG
jgi:hypothetical protein